MRILMSILIHMKSLLLVALIINLCCQIISIPAIYGVRWFLGSKFAFKPSSFQKTQSSTYTCMFNSQQQINLSLELSINNQLYSCSSKRVNLPNNSHCMQTYEGPVYTYGNFSTYIHICHINSLFSIQQPYSIHALDILYHNQSGKTKMAKSQKLILYQSIFRPIPQQKSYQLLSIGDWGRIDQKIVEQHKYTPILECVLKKVKQNPTIAGVLFLGDLGYDMEGQPYVQMLKYIEPLTSQMVWIGVPGNHDTTYHDDNFVLYTQSFLTPLWSQYFSYFFTAQITKNLLIVGLNPQKEFFNLTRIPKDLNQVFQTQFTKQNLELIKKEKTVIVMNHYPVYCSQLNQDKKGACAPKNLTFYSKYFDKMGMDLYLSGHLHVYERSKPICYIQQNQKGETLFGNQFIGKCPIYIIEGTAGNNYFVQTTEEYQAQLFNEKMVLNTGFGILHIRLNGERSTEQLKYEHISADVCSVSDTVNIPIQQQNQRYMIWIKFSAFGILFFAASFVTLLRFKQLSNLKKKERNPVNSQQEFQNFQAVRTSRTLESDHI